MQQIDVASDWEEFVIMPKFKNLELKVARSLRELYEFPGLSDLKSRIANIEARLIDSNRVLYGSHLAWHFWQWMALSEADAHLNDTELLQRCVLGQYDENERLENFLDRLQDIVYRQREPPSQKTLELKLRLEVFKDPRMTNLVSLYNMRCTLGEMERSYLGLLGMTLTHLEELRREKTSRTHRQSRGQPTNLALVATATETPGAKEPDIFFLSR